MDSKLFTKFGVMCAMSCALSLAGFGQAGNGFQNNSTQRLTYKLFAAERGTYGYDIFRNNKLYVHQPTMPTRPGKLGFASKKDAERAANLVIRKIRLGIMPPTLSSKDLDSLGIKR
jgi:hypothetical protein